MIPHLEPDSGLIRNLMKIPTKADGNFLRLSDVCGHGKSMIGQFVNLLVAVAHVMIFLLFKKIILGFFQVGVVRTVVTRKNNDSAPCRELVIMDETERDFRVTLWDLDILHLADEWKPRKTSLYKKTKTGFRKI